jgi:AraC-like DNA-binding protein
MRTRPRRVIDANAAIVARDAMDALSDVLRTIHLDGAIYLDAEFTAPWCINARYGFAHVSKRLPQADHLVYFHFVIEGSCKVRLADGGEPIDVKAGDMILFPRDESHLMGSDFSFPALLVDEWAAGVEDPIAMQALHAGGGGEPTRFVCSYLACSRAVYRPLFEALPRLLVIDVGGAGVAVRELLRVGVRESAASQPGAGAMLAKLAEFLFIEAMRRYVDTLPPDGRGWLAGVRDPHVGRALALMHGDPAKPWTVDELAQRVALSRSALGERFVALVGESPIQYLVRWRLALAAQALRTTGDSLGRVAHRAGYESEAAFNRAFKREFGMPPATWRKANAPA